MGSLVYDDGIGYPVVQGLLPRIKEHPQKSRAACSEAQQVAQRAQTGLRDCHSFSCVGIDNPQMQRPFPR